MLLATVNILGEVSTTNSVLNLLAPLLILTMVLVALTAIINRRFTHALIMVIAAGASSLIFYSTPVLNAMTSFFNNFLAGLTGESKEASDTPVPLTKDSVSSAEMPWDVLGFIAATILILAVAATLFAIGFSKYKAASRDRKRNIAGWEKLIEQHNEIRKEWSSYETDMAKVIDFPMMNDLKEPVITILHTSLRKAIHLEPSSVRTVSHISFMESPFAKAVQELESAFKTAEREARRIAWSNYTVGERKHLAKAKDLLSLAMDKSASASERQIAYKRVIKELEGLVCVPAKAILSIESSNKLELETV